MVYIKIYLQLFHFRNNYLNLLFIILIVYALNLFYKRQSRSRLQNELSISGKIHRLIPLIKKISI